MGNLHQLSRARRFLLLTTVVFLACLVLALLGESAVRVRQWLKHGNLWRIEDTYIDDPKSGLRIPIPGIHVGAIRINSRGFRGPEIALPKPTSTIRLAFLGASTTYCAEVSSNEMTWPHLVWKKLQEHWPSANFDYVNGGVPGYAVETSLRNLDRRITTLDPDVIIIYHATNDLSWRSFDLAVKQGLVEHRTEQTLSWLSKYSLLSYLVEKNIKILWLEMRAHDVHRKLLFDRRELAEPFQRDLTDLVRRAQSVASLVVLVTFSHRLRHGQTPEEQARAAVTSLYYMPYMSIDGLLTAFDAYNEAIRQVAKATGALLVNDELSIPGDSKHFVDSVHFTDAGSQAMAERVVSVLLKSEAFRHFVQRRISDSDSKATHHFGKLLQ
jgi:lysophospholipase L1-like esterase